MSLPENQTLPFPGHALTEWTMSVFVIVVVVIFGLAGNPAGLELRRMQMITEVGAEQNTMTIIMMPSEFVEMAKNLGGVRKSSA
jgi:hypothetical protein